MDKKVTLDRIKDLGLLAVIRGPSPELTMKMVDALGNSVAARDVGRQLLRAGTSVGANYRAALRARSKREFVARLGVVEEESDECAYWIELLIDSGKVTQPKAGPLLKEANEITAMIVATIRSTRNGKANPKSEIPNPK